MPLSSILQRIQQKGQVRPEVGQKSTNVAPRSSNISTSSTLSAPAPRDRPVDPVVARLKAARKAEREKQEAEARAKKGLGPKKESKPRKTKSSSPSEPSPRTSRRPSSVPPKMPPPARPQEKKPKMSFNELMKKASLIDQSKMTIQYKAKSRSPPETPKKTKMEARKSRPPQKDMQEVVKSKIPKKEAPRKPQDSKSATNDTGRIRSEPLPTRRPNAALEQRLQQKKQRSQKQGGRGESYRGEEYEDEQEDSDMGSFIASDDEEQDSYAQDYDRDEIWAMFNRGKKRSHYDYDDDSDDMEATGAEIFEEENLSKRRAIAEDKREMEEEQRLAEMKKKRIGKR